MKLILWLTIGLVLGPSYLSLPLPAYVASIINVAGALFLFFAGWELRFLDLRKDAVFYGKSFLGCFVFPLIVGFLVYAHNAFLAIAIAISALPVAIQILKEKNLFNTTMGKRVVTLASLCDVCAWGLMIFVFPAENLQAWVLSHWVILAFFVGLIVGLIKPIPAISKIENLQMWVLAPAFFVGLGWKVDIVKSFSLSVFVSLFLVFIATKFVGSYWSLRWAGEDRRQSLNIASLLNARGAMEIVAAHFALQAGLIEGSVFSALVLIGLVTSLMAIPIVRK
jgi:Kef-type K+ transport system membrane component KefB